MTDSQDAADLLLIVLLVVLMLLGALELWFWENEQTEHHAKQVKAAQQNGGHFWVNPAGDRRED